jgi:hypothetical protein
MEMETTLSSSNTEEKTETEIQKSHKKTPIPENERISNPPRTRAKPIRLADRANTEVPVRIADTENSEEPNSLEATSALNINACEFNNPEEPNSLYTALNGENRDNWKAAINEEIGNLLSNNTWEITSRPLRRKVIKANGYSRLRKMQQEKLQDSRRDL